MAEQVDINDVLDGFTAEIGALTRRAIIAETTAIGVRGDARRLEAELRAKNDQIEHLKGQVEELQGALEAREALDAATEEPEPGPEKKVAKRPVQNFPHQT